jgi:hypothetical protein
MLAMMVLPFFKMMNPDNFDVQFFNLYQLIGLNVVGFMLLMGVICFLWRTQPEFFGMRPTVFGVVVSMLLLWLLYCLISVGSVLTAFNLIGVGYWLILMTNIAFFVIDKRYDDMVKKVDD